MLIAQVDRFPSGITALQGEPTVDTVHRHSWRVTPKTAVAIQNRLRPLISTRPFRGRIRFVAGADAAFSSNPPKVHAAVTVHSFPDLEFIEHKTATLSLHFPYVPGLLTFREGPGVLRCFKKLHTEPDLVLFDGQGLLHPRKMGLATHLGILLNKPSVGCAKSRLYGTCEEPEAGKGSYTPVREENGDVQGVCLRTRDNTRPLFVSVGSNMSLDQAVETVLGCCPLYRIPEPLRTAHRFADSQKKQKRKK